MNKNDCIADLITSKCGFKKRTKFLLIHFHPDGFFHVNTFKLLVINRLSIDRTEMVKSADSELNEGS